MSASTQADQIRAYAEKIKPELFRPAAGILRHDYLSAGLGNTYPDLTDWDAVWAGSAYLIAGDPRPLKDSLVNLLEHIQPDGKGQRRIGKNGYSAPPYQIRPFLAAGCYVLSRDTDDVSWLGDEGLDALEGYLLYRHNRGTGRDGLLTWYHIDEGFGDNGTGNWAWEESSVQAVDLNAQMVYEHSCFAAIAERAGEDKRAAKHRRLAQRLCDGINNLLWHEEDQHYYSLYVPPRRYDRSTHIRAIYSANLWPLWVGIAPEDKAKAVIERYVLDEEHYWSTYGIRSLSKSERHFNNGRRGLNMPTGYRAFQGPAIDTSTCSNVQGPIWSFVNYFASSYLTRYGYQDKAQYVAEMMVKIHAESLDQYGGFYENYSSETGEALCALGIGSWTLMIPEALETVNRGTDFWFHGLELPRPSGN